MGRSTDFQSGLRLRLPQTGRGGRRGVLIAHAVLLPRTWSPLLLPLHTPLSPHQLLQPKLQSYQRSAFNTKLSPCQPLLNS